MAARWTRRELCIRTAGAAVAAAVAPFFDGLGVPSLPTALAASSDIAGRAADAYAAMQRYFYDEGQKLYRERAQGDADGSLAYFWTFEEAARATLYMYGLPDDGRAYSGAIQDRLNG